MSTPPLTKEIMGFGWLAGGSGPGGLFEVAEVAPRPDASAGSRFLNPVSRDFEIDPETNQYAQMPATRQRVLLALLTVFGSATAKPQFGLKVPDKIRSTFKKEVDNAARSALSHLTLADAAVIRIDDIDVSIPRPGTAILTVSYTDLNTLEPDSTALPIGG